jgi:hypothetical protein
VPFGGATPPPHVFNALLWLRRGLAARDPLVTYGALMNGLQAVARGVAGPRPDRTPCPQCGAVKGGDEAESVRSLVVERLGAPVELFERVWRARNVVLAHSDEPVTAETLRVLTELKFDAATLCYQAIKLALGLPIDGPPALDRGQFITSTLMDVH